MAHLGHGGAFHFDGQRLRQRSAQRGAFGGRADETITADDEAGPQRGRRDAERRQQVGPEVRAYCEQNLTGYKRPRIIEFRTELPNTPVGKILRRELRNK